MSHISANNIDRKLIIVSMSMFSGSRNPNVTIIWVCGGCGSHFQNGRHEFSMSHISANNIDRKLILVYLSLLSGSQIQNMVNILVCGGCGGHFQNGQLHQCKTNYMFLFVVSAVVYSYEAPYAITLTTII